MDHSSGDHGSTSYYDIDKDIFVCGNYLYTYDDDIYPVEIYHDKIYSAFYFFHVVCLILIFCISVPGNGFLLWALLKERAWKTTSGILLLQLTLSDLCLTVTLPFWSYGLLHGWSFGDLACRIINGVFFLWLNSYVLILAAMTLYRYVAVVRASCLSARAPKKWVLMASIVIWLVSAATSIKISVTRETTGFYGLTRLIDPFTMQLFDVSLQIVLFFFIPFIIITFCCIHMCVTMKQCKINQHHRAARLILGMIFVFFLCLVPYNIILFIQTWMIGDVVEFMFGWSEAMKYLNFTINTLPYLHCCLNPLFHLFGAQRFKRHLPVPCNSSSPRKNESPNLSSAAESSIHVPLCD